MASQMIDLKAVAERFGVGQHTVIAWVKSGQLKAINVARVMGRKPKWKFTEQALADFERLRTTAPPLPPRQKPKPAAGVTKFY